MTPLTCLLLMVNMAGRKVTCRRANRSQYRCYIEKKMLYTNIFLFANALFDANVINTKNMFANDKQLS